MSTMKKSVIATTALIGGVDAIGFLHRRSKVPTSTPLSTSQKEFLEDQIITLTTKLGRDITCAELFCAWDASGEPDSSIIRVKEACHTPATEHAFFLSFMDSDASACDTDDISKCTAGFFVQEEDDEGDEVYAGTNDGRDERTAQTSLKNDSEKQGKLKELASDQHCPSYLRKYGEYDKIRNEHCMLASGEACADEHNDGCFLKSSALEKVNKDQTLILMMMNGSERLPHEFVDRLNEFGRVKGLPSTHAGDRTTVQRAMVQSIIDHNREHRKNVIFVYMGEKEKAIPGVDDSLLKYVAEHADVSYVKRVFPDECDLTKNFDKVITALPEIAHGLNHDDWTGSDMQSTIDDESV